MSDVHAHANVEEAIERKTLALLHQQTQHLATIAKALTAGKTQERDGAMLMRMYELEKRLDRMDAVDRAVDLSEIAEDDPRIDAYMDAGMAADRADARRMLARNVMAMKLVDAANDAESAGESRDLLGRANALVECPDGGDV